MLVGLPVSGSRRRRHAVLADEGPDAEVLVRRVFRVRDWPRTAVHRDGGLRAVQPIPRIRVAAAGIAHDLNRELGIDARAVRTLRRPRQRNPEQTALEQLRVRTGIVRRQIRDSSCRPPPQTADPFRPSPSTARECCAPTATCRPTAGGRSRRRGRSCRWVRRTGALSCRPHRTCSARRVGPDRCRTWRMPARVSPRPGSTTTSTIPAPQRRRQPKGTRRQESIAIGSSGVHCHATRMLCGSTMGHPRKDRSNVRWRSFLLPRHVRLPCALDQLQLATGLAALLFAGLLVNWVTNPTHSVLARGDAADYQESSL